MDLNIDLNNLTRIASPLEGKGYLKNLNAIEEKDENNNTIYKINDLVFYLDYGYNCITLKNKLPDYMINILKEIGFYIYDNNFNHVYFLEQLVVIYLLFNNKLKPRLFNNYINMLKLTSFIECSSFVLNKFNSKSEYSYFDKKLIPFLNDKMFFSDFHEKYVFQTTRPYKEGDYDCIVFSFYNKEYPNIKMDFEFKEDYYITHITINTTDDQYYNELCHYVDSKSDQLIYYTKSREFILKNNNKIKESEIIKSHNSKIVYSTNERDSNILDIEFFNNILNYYIEKIDSMTKVKSK